MGGYQMADFRLQMEDGNALGFGTGDDIHIGPEGAGHNSPGQRPGFASSTASILALKGPDIKAQGNALGA
jgi:hypothetical protein